MTALNAPRCEHDTRRLDLAGRRVGHSVCLRDVGVSSPVEYGRLWECRCDCGVEFFAHTKAIRTRKCLQCQSCTYAGALKRLVDNRWVRVTHGASIGWTKVGRLPRLFRLWHRMRSRLVDPNNRWYYGLSIDPAWHDYRRFEAWALANGYAEDLVLSRRVSADGYWPSNCYWGAARAANRRGALQAWHPEALVNHA